jgi:hypothetical protein
MHLFVGALLVLGGLGCLRYVWGGETAFESEPPLLALSVVLVATGVGLAMRARAALLLAQVALGGTVLVLATKALRLYVGGPHDTADDSLVALAHLFGYALAAAGVVVLVLLLRRVRAEAEFGPIDYVPLGGLAAALVLGLVWLVADDARLRPCRNGSDEACSAVAVTLLEASERRPASTPSRAEERAARVLAEHHCRSVDRGPCGLQRYAAGTVDARAGRVDQAKEAFLWACQTDRSWCARAAQAPLPWTVDERQRLGDGRR